MGQGEDSIQDTFSLRIRDLVQLIVNRANDDSLHGQSLSKLHTLHEMSVDDGQHGVDMICILLFLALNSLRHASHHWGFATIVDINGNEQADEDNESNANGSEDGNMDVDEEKEEDGYDNSSQHSSIRSRRDSETQREDSRKEWLDNYANDFISPRYSVLGTNIQTLNFYECVVGPDAITNILRNMRNLEDLSFNYNMFDAYGDDWDIDGFVMGIMHTVGSHLEWLDISCGQVNPNSTLLENDLHGFKVLKDLRITTTLFTNNEAWVGGWNYPDDWSDPARPVVGVLPKSLERFELGVPCADYECLMDLFRRWNIQREKKLPSLKHVMLYVGRRDCWGDQFRDYLRKEKIIELLAKEYGVVARFEEIS